MHLGNLASGVASLLQPSCSNKKLDFCCLFKFVIQTTSCGCLSILLSMIEYGPSPKLKAYENQLNLKLKSSSYWQTIMIQDQTLDKTISNLEMELATARALQDSIVAIVCSMFEEAASSSSSVIKRLRDKECTNGVVEEIELNDMLESVGMVFVQSLKELGR